jgi:hypothetical protein
VIYDLEEPRGLQRLAELGEALYSRGGTKGSKEKNPVAQAGYLIRGGF